MGREGEEGRGGGKRERGEGGEGETDGQKMDRLKTGGHKEASTQTKMYTDKYQLCSDLPFFCITG